MHVLTVRDVFALVCLSRLQEGEISDAGESPGREREQRITRLV